MSTVPGKVTRFSAVDVTVGGLFGFRLDAFDDGTSINITPIGDKNTLRRGNDGKDAFAESAGLAQTWTVSHLETSDSNDRLSAWLAAGVTAPVSYKERDGRTTWSGFGRIRNYAPVTKSGGVETRTWDILVTGVTGKVGGTDDP